MTPAATALAFGIALALVVVLGLLVYVGHGLVIQGRSPRPSGGRGTLTVLPDGRLILGVPGALQLPASTLDGLLNGFRVWLDEAPPGRPLIVNFPIDVVVLRDHPPDPPVDRERIRRRLEAVRTGNL